MVQYVRNSELDDAYEFLNLATGLPDNASGKKTRGMFLRAALVFCWLAIEVSVKAILEEQCAWGYSGTMPGKLSERIILIHALKEIWRQSVSAEVLDSISNINDRRKKREEIVKTAFNNPIGIEKSLCDSRKNFDLNRFRQMRKIRNDLMHVNANCEELSVRQVKLLFEYSKEMIGSMEGLKVVHMDW